LGVAPRLERLILYHQLSPQIAQNFPMYAGDIVIFRAACDKN